jgi:predicted metal-dependent peptidase
LRRNEEKKLANLICFTDGCGVFPAQKPDYDTAFVFVEDEYNNPDVPRGQLSWYCRKMKFKAEHFKIKKGR